MTDKIDSKEKLEGFIAEAAKGTAMAVFAEFRKEQEAKDKEVSASFEKRLAEALSERKAVDATAKKGMELAQIVRFYAAGKGDTAKAAVFAKDGGASEGVIKALATAPNSAGGYVIPPGYSSDLIDLLYNKVAVRKLGATSVPMPNGQMTFPKLATGIAASYIGENKGQNSQTPSFGVVTLSWKKLRATVPLSNDLIRYSNPKADTVVQNDLTNAFAIAEDAAFLRGTGSGLSPKGIDNWIPTTPVNHAPAAASADGSDLTLVIQDLFRLPKLLEEANIPFISPGWVISPRTKYFLMSVRDGVGNFYFMEEMRRGTLLGYPYISTNQVPSNLGTGSDESVIYFGDWNDALIGESTDLIVDISQDAAYQDENGDLVSAFNLDQTVIRGIARHDFVVRRERSFAKLTGVEWGA